MEFKFSNTTEVGEITFAENELKVIVKNKVEDIDDSSLSIVGKQILYSLPCNVNYEAWTKKSKVGKIAKPHIVMKMWSWLKPGMKVEVIRKDKRYVIEKVVTKR
jgi:hypothetical protein